MVGVDRGVLLSSGISLARVIYSTTSARVVPLGRVVRPRACVAAAYVAFAYARLAAACVHVCLCVCACLRRAQGDSGAYRALERFPGVARPIPGVVLLRFDAILSFANLMLFQVRVLDASDACRCARVGMPRT